MTVYCYTYIYSRALPIPISRRQQGSEKKNLYHTYGRIVFFTKLHTLSNQLAIGATSLAAKLVHGWARWDFWVGDALECEYFISRFSLYRHDYYYFRRFYIAPLSLSPSSVRWGMGTSLGWIGGNTQIQEPALRLLTFCRLHRIIAA